MVRLPGIFCACALLLGGLAPAALAQGTNAPPGNSGVQQYLETVPDAGGDRPSGTAAPAGTAAPQLPARVQERLKAAGPDGEAVAQLVASTGTPDRKRPSGKRQPRKPGAKATAPVQATPAPATVPRTIAAPALLGSGTGGMGILLPVLLAGSAIVAAFVGLRRHRAR